MDVQGGQTERSQERQVEAERDAPGPAESCGDRSPDQHPEYRVGGLAVSAGDRLDDLGQQVGDRAKGAADRGLWMIKVGQHRRTSCGDRTGQHGDRVGSAAGHPEQRRDSQVDDGAAGGMGSPHHGRASFPLERRFR